MSATEFAFLALGLVLGVATGAALVETLRARPRAPREVRVTVMPHAVPRRASTLADATTAIVGPEPARGGPADRRLEADGPPPGTPDRRTPVHSTVRGAAGGTARFGTDGVGEGVAAWSSARRDHRPGIRLTDPGSTARLAASAALVGIPVSGGDDPMLASLRGGGEAMPASSIRTSAATAVLDAPGGSRDAPLPDAERPQATAHTGDVPTGASADGSASTVDGAAAPCADARQAAEERCEVATRARTQAVAAEDVLRAAHRAYEEHEAAADRSMAIADPRTVRQAKDQAQTRFRDARTIAGTQEAVEVAARAWLVEINRINGEARTASATMLRERESARAVGASLDRLSLEAEAARIGAETAEAACLAARQAVADCEERALSGDVGIHRPAGSGDAPSVGDALAEPLVAALGTGGTPRIFRLVRGDRAAMVELVSLLGGADPEDRRRWQVAISNLVDAILAASIEATALHFPTDGSFWEPFTQSQGREIAEALSSLGYRFDGLGGWADDRIPSQRDLSLALGYAGLDPMRMRHWPTEQEMTELYREVTVVADEHLAAEAGDLSLAELVTMLGRRAEGLAEVWNHWGQLRPLLLAEG